MENKLTGAGCEDYMKTNEDRAPHSGLLRSGWCPQSSALTPPSRITAKECAVKRQPPLVLKAKKSTQ
ncbi:hypothetical protein EYF80_027009 [Liparis tanakae]|uniref:Uncharacterized protein n=1 Tax=Liparis tanakae TaxID=230148 RepID=A0A4Z2HCN8_9TELE|nr:hypothetical protein EYF80_027009 [Liparis tanakae]